MTRPTCAEVRLGAIQENLRALRGLLAPGVKVLGVVKADAYGHGAVPVARALQDAGVDVLGVALVAEGVELRRAGLQTPILVLATVFEDDVAALVAHDLAAAVDEGQTARRIDAEAARAGRRAPVHLKVDTGMNRLGVRAEEAAALAAELAGLAHLALEGVCTHLACAEAAGDPSVAAQLARFREVLAALEAAGLRPPLVHAANSAATITLPASHFTMVRPGLALYGISPCPGAEEKVRLRPALALRTRVARLKRVRAGEGVSYGHTWRAVRDSLIGVLPAGYGDGYPRALSNRAAARIGERLCPVVGTVCMDATMVDLTDVPGARAGMEVALLEADNASPAGARALADRAGTIPYEILTGISRRVRRVYI